MKSKARICYYDEEGSAFYWGKDEIIAAVKLVQSFISIVIWVKRTYNYYTL